MFVRFGLFETTIKNQLLHLKDQINDIKKASSLVQRCVDDMMQHSNRRKLIFYGLSEKHGEILNRNVECIKNKLSTQIQRKPIQELLSSGQKPSADKT